MVDQVIRILPRSARRRQEQRFAEKINAARRTLQAARADADVIGYLINVKYDQERLQLGMEYCKMAQCALASRQWALCSQQKAELNLEKAQAEARLVFRDFRSVARLLFIDRSIRQDLHLDEKMPEETRKLIPFLRSSFGAVSENLYLRLSLCEYGSLDALQEALQALIEAELAWSSSRRAAALSLDKLDKAVTSLNQWMSEFIASASIALQARPDLLQKLAI